VGVVVVFVADDMVCECEWWTQAYLPSRKSDDLWCVIPINFVQLFALNFLFGQIQIRSLLNHPVAIYRKYIFGSEG